MKTRLLLIAILLTGCSRTFVIPEITDTHPASPKAPEAPITTFRIQDKFQADMKRLNSTQLRDTQHQKHMHHQMGGMMDSKQQEDLQ